MTAKNNFSRDFRLGVTILKYLDIQIKKALKIPILLINVIIFAWKWEKRSKRKNCQQMYMASSIKKQHFLKSCGTSLCKKQGFANFISHFIAFLEDLVEKVSIFYTLYFCIRADLGGMMHDLRSNCFIFMWGNMLASVNSHSIKDKMQHILEKRS